MSSKAAIAEMGISESSGANTGMAGVMNSRWRVMERATWPPLERWQYTGRVAAGYTLT